MFDLENIYFQHVEKPINHKKVLTVYASFYYNVILDEMLIFVERCLTENL